MESGTRGYHHDIALGAAIFAGFLHRDITGFARASLLRQVHGIGLPTWHSATRNHHWNDSSHLVGINMIITAGLYPKWKAQLTSPITQIMYSMRLHLGVLTFALPGTLASTFCLTS